MKLVDDVYLTPRAKVTRKPRSSRAKKPATTKLALEVPDEVFQSQKKSAGARKKVPAVDVGSTGGRTEKVCAQSYMRIIVLDLCDLANHISA